MMIEYREIHAKDLYFIDEFEPDSFRKENAITCCNLDLTQIDMTFLVYTAPKDSCFFMFDKYPNLYTQESVWVRSLTSAEKRVINNHFKLAGIPPKRIPFESGGTQFCLCLFVPNRCVSEVKKYFEDQVRLAGSDIIIPSQQYDGFSKHPTVLQVDRFLSNIKALQIFLLNCKQDRSLLLEHPIIARLDCRLQIWGVLRKNLSYSREFSYSNLNIQGDVPASNQYNIEGKAYVAALIRLLGWYAFYDLAKLYIELIEEANTDFFYFLQSKTRNGKMKFLHHTELAAILLPGWCGVKCIVQQTLKKCFCTKRIILRSPVRENRMQGSVRGRSGKWPFYLDETT